MIIYRMWGYPIFRETKLYTQFASCKFFWCKKTYSASKKRAPAHGIFVPRQEEVLNVCSTIQRDNSFFLTYMYDHVWLFVKTVHQLPPCTQDYRPFASAIPRSSMVFAHGKFLISSININHPTFTVPINIQRITSSHLNVVRKTPWMA